MIGQVAIGDKDREIRAARAVLRLLDLNGALVRGDARHCPGETARLINQRGSDWLFTLKQNRPHSTPKWPLGLPTRRTGPRRNTSPPTPTTDASR